MSNEYTIELNEAALNNADKFVIKTYFQEDVATHDHNFFELVYVMGGSTLHTLNGISGPLGLGDVLYSGLRKCALLWAKQRSNIN